MLLRLSTLHCGMVAYAWEPSCKAVSLSQLKAAVWLSAAVKGLEQPHATRSPVCAVRR